MKRQRTVVLGLVMAGTLAFPAVAGAAGLDGAVGDTGLNSRMNPPTEPVTHDPVGSAQADGTQFVPCDCLNHRLPAFDSPLEAAAG